ncbi:MAG: BrnT family toxin [Thermodesulfobacteriota bacterium]|nr:BrnT family toxin [Thermodesulfobacteriota bacterium]
MEWDESKRRKNLSKHGLDFSDAGIVLENPFKLDVAIIRNHEQRIQSFAYVFDQLAVLTVVYTIKEERIISFRRASRNEREVYHEWLANEFE